MKKFIAGLVAALFAVTAFAEVVDVSVGGTDSVGASAMSKALVFSQTIDFAKTDVANGDTIKFVSLPAGVAPLFAVVSAEDVNQSFTNTVVSNVGTNDYSSAGSANVLTYSALVPVLSWLSFPTISATGPQSTNMTVTASTTAAKALSSISYGLTVTASTTSGLPTEGKLTLSVTAFDVAPR
jgi:hypothetical protein